MRGRKNKGEQGIYLGNLQVIWYDSKRREGQRGAGQQGKRGMGGGWDPESLGCFPAGNRMPLEGVQAGERHGQRARGTLTAMWKMDWMEEAGNQTGDGWNGQIY